jgi:hypothetical protein
LAGARMIENEVQSPGTASPGTSSVSASLDKTDAPRRTWCIGCTKTKQTNLLAQRMVCMRARSWKALPTRICRGSRCRTALGGMADTMRSLRRNRRRSANCSRPMQRPDWAEAGGTVGTLALSSDRWAICTSVATGSNLVHQRLAMRQVHQVKPGASDESDAPILHCKSHGRHRSTAMGSA